MRGRRFLSRNDHHLIGRAFSNAVIGLTLSCKGSNNYSLFHERQQRALAKFFPDVELSGWPPSREFVKQFHDNFSATILTSSMDRLVTSDNPSVFFRLENSKRSTDGGFFPITKNKLRQSKRNSRSGRCPRSRQANGLQSYRRINSQIRTWVDLRRVDVLRSLSILLP